MIDHLVYATNNFEESIEWFEKASGIAPVFGGYHKDKGTKNALVKIGRKAYLEIIAVDPQNFQIKENRWMGLDLIEEAKLTRWAIQSDELSKEASALKNYNKAMGEIHAGSRETSSGAQLNWKMILPLAEPEVELAPFVIDWEDSIHPAIDLQEGCDLLTLKFSHPNPEKIHVLFSNMGLHWEVIKSDEVSIHAELETPRGLIRI